MASVRERMDETIVLPAVPTRVAIPARLAIRPGPRELREIEGVGRARAVDVARFLWSESGSPHGGLDRLDSIPGIGPVTANRIASALGQPRGAEVDSSDE